MPTCQVLCVCLQGPLKDCGIVQCVLLCTRLSVRRCMEGKQNNIILIKLCKLNYVDGGQTAGLLHMLMLSGRQAFVTAQQSLYMTLIRRNYTLLISDL